MAWPFSQGHSPGREKPLLKPIYSGLPYTTPHLEKVILETEREVPIAAMPQEAEG